MWWYPLGLALFVTTGWVEGLETLQSPVISLARIESCGGCRLQSLPEVRDFLQNDFQHLYAHTLWKKMPGKWPELTFRDESQRVIERLDIRHHNRTQLNRIMQSHGFNPIQP